VSCVDVLSGLADATPHVTTPHLTSPHARPHSFIPSEGSAALPPGHEEVEDEELDKEEVARLKREKRERMRREALASGAGGGGEAGPEGSGDEGDGGEDGFIPLDGERLSKGARRLEKVRVSRLVVFTGFLLFLCPGRGDGVLRCGGLDDYNIHEITDGARVNPLLLHPA
jgi:hypothetical protein